MRCPICGAHSNSTSCCGCTITVSGIKKAATDSPAGKARVAHVNADHLWRGAFDGYNSALNDSSNRDHEDNRCVAVVALADYAELNEKLRVAVAALEEITKPYKDIGLGCYHEENAREALTKIKGGD